MYSYEIQNVLESNLYCIDSETYLRICGSSQIKEIKYDAFCNNFHIWTNDGYYWKFVVKNYLD